jgi:hypothetical protein
MGEAQGRLPKWPLASGETNCMIGLHSVVMLADGLAAGLGTMVRRLTAPFALTWTLQSTPAVNDSDVLAAMTRSLRGEEGPGYLNVGHREAARS